MKALQRVLPCLAAMTALSSPAQAHFKLMSPTPWIVEDDVGGPQKGGPCGPGGGDGSPTMSMEVTTVHAGDTLKVEMEETIHHPGWFRIALAENRDDFEEIKFTGAGCSYDLATVPTKPHDNVLADGVGMDNNLAGSNRKLTEMVTIPDQPCEKCTLQVIQVMADTIHSPPGCIYYHCADLKILPKEGSAPSATAAGAGAAGMMSAKAGAGGSTTAATGSAGAGAAAGASATPNGAGGMMSMTGASTPTSTTTTSPATTAPSGAAGKVGMMTSGSSTTTSGASTAGSSASKPSTTPAGSTAASTSAGSAEPSAEKSGGCAVAAPGTRSGLFSALGFALVGLALFSRRRRSA